MKKPISDEQREKFRSHWKDVGEKVLEHPDVGEWQIDSIIARDLAKLPRVLSATGIGVAVPCGPGRSTVEETLGAVSKLAFEFGLRPDTQQSFEIANNREKLVQRFTEAGYRRMLFLDSDTVVDGNGFSQLMRTMDRWGAAVVAAIVPQRFSAEYNCFHEDPNNEKNFVPLKKEDLPKSLTAFPVPYVGLACALLDLEQIRNHPGPRFMRVAEGHKHKGEDILFCEWIHKNEMQVVVDPAVSTMHCIQHRFIYEPPKKEEG